MQFLLTGYDGPDAEALDRRLAVRDQHIALGDVLRDAGNMLYGGALLDEDDKMIGSVLILDFAGRDELDAWLKVEPYVTGNVWQRIEIQPFRVGPSFVGLHL
jgi:uncharacterized protein YciI